MLNPDSDSSSTNHQDEVAPSNFEQRSLRQISQYHSLTQANPMTSVGESRAFSDSLHRGTWETFLVFGMICVAIIASMSSVIWFIRSYRSDGDSGDTQRIRRGRGDVESLDGSSGYSYDDTFSSTSSHHNSLDTRSDFEVELDFEFSEDVNRPEIATTKTESAAPSSAQVLSPQQNPTTVHSFA